MSALGADVFVVNRLVATSDIQFSAAAAAATSLNMTTQ